MRNQRGFVLTLWLAVGAAVAFAAMGVAVKVQTSRLDSAKADLTACETRYKETLILVEKQNKAVSALETESKKRATIAAAALAKARQGQGSLNAEIARLRAATAGSCEAGVAEVRKGLRK